MMLSIFPTGMLMRNTVIYQLIEFFEPLRRMIDALTVRNSIKIDRVCMVLFSHAQACQIPVRL
jgi:hypothetical protein